MTWKDTLNLPVSAQGEWAAKRFYGDPKLAAAYLPVAYALLGEVKNRMAYGGVSYGHRMIELPDGTRIRVIRNGEQNILEIETVPVVGREIFPGTGIAGMIFYPRTESVPLGIYTPAGPAARHPVPVDQLPFATLSYQYNEEDSKFDLSAAAPVNTQSGNQFFQEPGGAVFSWWHSPHGDGPLIMYSNPESTYTPFLSNNAVYYRNVAKGPPILLGRVIYRSGVPWFSVPTGNIVAGFWAGVVEVSDTFSEWRCLVALYSATGTLTLQGYKTSAVTSSGMTALPTSTEPLSWDLGNIANLRASWPVRFSPAGDKAAVIVGAINQLMVVELSVSHTEEGYEYSKTEETVFALGLRRQTVTTRSSGSWVEPKRANGGIFTFFSRTVGFQEHRTTGESVLLDAAARFPLALDYKATGELRVIYHVPDFSPSTYDRHARSEITFTALEDEYRIIGNNVNYDYVAWESNHTGFSRDTYDNFSSYFHSGFSLVDDSNQTVLSYIERTGEGFNNIIFTGSYAGVRLADLRGSPWINDSIIIDNRATEGNYKNGRPGQQVYFNYIGVKNNNLLYYVLNHADGTYGTQNRTQSSYDRSWGTFPGPQSRDTISTREVAYHYGTEREAGVALTLSVENNEHAYTDQVGAKTENQDYYRNHNERYSRTGLPDVVVAEEEGKKNIGYPHNIIPGQYNTCNIFGAAAPNIARAPYNLVTETVTDQPISLAAIINLFNPWAAIEFSFVRDERLEGRPVWAYSFKFDWESNFVMPGGAIVPLKLSDTKTDSTFGPLTQHVFLLDAEGVITGQPVNDPTLTTHPIGLF